MAIDLSALSTATSTATALGNLILVTPQTTIGYQPQNAPSWQKNTAAAPAALVFNYEGEQSVSLDSDITDHYIEDNTALQDQWALKPVMVATQGFIGELNDIAPAILAPLQTAASKLTAISAYTPSLSTTALLAYANAFQLYQVAASVANSAVDTWSSINGQGGESVISGAGLSVQPNQTQQQIYFQLFFGYRQNRTLFTVQTPWAIFQDMAIASLRPIQDATTKEISTFEVSFKQLRFATTQIAQLSLFDANDMDGRAAQQGSSTVDFGTNTLQTSPTAFTTQVA